MQDAIIKLKLLGQIPDAVKDDPAVETINLYDELLSNVKPPLTKEEVRVLINIFPEGGMYGVEWDLLKLVESYLIETPSNNEYRELIAACPSKEWRETMQVRLDNWDKRISNQQSTSSLPVCKADEIRRMRFADSKQ